MASNTKSPIDPKQHESLQNEVADILLGPDSPVRGMDDFEQFINEQDRLVQRQAELKSLDTKLVEILMGIEQVEAKLAEVEKELAAEKKMLAGFATELGTAAFAGLRAGELPDNPLFANRKELQSRIDSLQSQKAELVAGENAGMMEKAKIQAQQLKLAGQIKVEEFKISKADRALGESMLTSKEKLSVRCSHTEEVLEAIASQRKQVTAAREKVKQAEKVVEDHKASAAEALGQSTARDASSLKSELKEVRQEHRQNKNAITSVRGSAVAQALETESLREEAAVGEKLKQLWSLNFELEANKPQGIKMVDESVSRFKGLPPKYKYGSYGGAGVAILLLAMLVIGGGDTDDSLPDGKEATAEVKDEEAQVNDEAVAEAKDKNTSKIPEGPNSDGRFAKNTRQEVRSKTAENTKPSFTNSRAEEHLQLPIDVFMELTSLEKQFATGCRHIVFTIVEKIDRDTYHIVVTAQPPATKRWKQHAILKTTATEYKTKGKSDMRVKRTGSKSLKLEDGFAKDFEIYSECVDVSWEEYRKTLDDFHKNKVIPLRQKLAAAILKVQPVKSENLRYYDEIIAGKKRPLGISLDKDFSDTASGVIALDEVNKAVWRVNAAWNKGLTTPCEYAAMDHDSKLFSWLISIGEKPFNEPTAVENLIAIAAANPHSAPGNYAYGKDLKGITACIKSHAAQAASNK